MSAEIPVERVAEILRGASFRRLNTPLNVAGIEFDMPAAFVGTKLSSDLVLLFDTAFESQKRIQHKVEGIARALDVVGSRRSLTTVVTGPRPDKDTFDSLSRVSRVLPVGLANNPADDESILNWLAVLLPLNIPSPSDVANEAVTSLSGKNADDIVTKLIEASVEGLSSVENCLNAYISKPIDDFFAVSRS